ncbi:protein piccolo isoform X2 [Cephus cinctus]|uniref:Protein piccolo isoform X2 n=1 Tax=Cephus cinctus TaxID=211228 RepID=A0AAJ7BVH5_CEPCN|nr:protein piccolo isoform X2 [Cephus cinctus]
MPGSQAAAASERRNDRMTTHEPPKLKTTLKTPPKQATNPLQFVKVGPCSLYRTAQEQLQKVQEVKKIKQEVRDDPEDWQSNLDNWKSSRRKRQEHIIERVVEVKKLELEEHDRQRRRSKTFSEMMEERGNRGRKMSISLAMYQEEDANDLSDLGIGTSSGKSSVSGDTHDDAHSVLSDRDSEIEKNHSDVDNNGTGENGNAVPNKKVADLDNGFHSHKHNHNHNHNHNQEYDSATTATASSPEPEEYTYEGAIRGYVSRVSQNIPMRRKSLANLDAKLNNSSVNSNDTGSKTSLNDEKNLPVVKVDIVKRREIFEKASQKNSDTKAKRLSGDFSNTKSIKERLSHLESQREDGENGGDKSNANSSSNKILKRLSGDMSSIRERLSNLEKQTSERESQSHHQASQKLEIAENSIRKPRAEELSDTGRPLRDRLMSLEKYTSTEKPFLVTPVAPPASEAAPKTCELSARSIKDRLNALDSSRKKDLDKRAMAKHILSFRDTETRIETSTPSERSSSPDSEYRIPRTAFHRSLDSLDADASSGPDTFERVQSLEELDYSRRYPASSSSAELLNDTDREDSGIHTADVSCSVSQADEPVDEDIGVHTAGSSIPERQEPLARRPEEPTPTNEPFKPAELAAAEPLSTALSTALSSYATEPEAVVTKKETAESSGELSTNNESQPQIIVDVTNSKAIPSTSNRPIVYQSPKVPARRTPPESPNPTSTSKPKPNPKPKPKTLLKVPQEQPATLTSTSSQIPVEPTLPKMQDDHSESNFDIAQDKCLDNNSNPNTVLSLNLEKETTSEDTSPTRTTSSPTTPHLAPTRTPRPDSGPSCNLQTANQTPKSSIISPSSPRGLSKIPTPLPRKGVSDKSSPTPSTGSQDQPKVPPPLKLRTLPPSPTSPSKKTFDVSPTTIATPTSSPETSSALAESESSDLEAPKDIRSNNCTNLTSPTTTLTSPATEVAAVQETPTPERRRTVVELCQKVVVPQGEAPTTPPVTPFITVESIVTENSIDKIIDSGRPMDQDDHKNPRVNSEKQRLSEQPEEKLKVLEDPLLVSTKNSAKSSFTDRTVKVSFGSNSSSTFGTTVNYPSALSTVSKQILPLNLSGDGGEEIVTGLSFTLGQPTSIEPPKEKPPPPPVDLSDEETVPVEPLKRLNSTRRIKKELRTRRSDFLGIEGVNDEELERELTLTKPPDMAAILAEERRIEQLHRRSYDTDSNYEQDSCHERDSGVELGHAEEWNNKAVSPDMSQHSRQSSEPFGASVTSSEEDEITKKEREIIEVLEKEEQWRYGNNHEENSDLGEKLAHKLRELEEEKMQLERERAQEVELRRQEDTFRKNEENIRKQEGTSLKRAQQEEVTRHQEMVRVEAEREAEARRVEEEKQEELRMQAERMRVRKEIEEKERRAAELRRHEDARVKSMGSQIREQEEVLRVERELLQLEQEELKRQRNNLVYRDQKKQQLAEHLEEQWKSLQDVAHVANSAANNVQQYKEVQVSPANYRSSMPNLQFQDGQRRRPPPPPIPPAKPLRLIEQRQRDVTIRNSRVPSADSIPHQVDTSLRQSASSGTLANYPGQQMSRQTLQALSAAPRPRIVQGDQWVQRRKSDVPRATQDFNYQHWLIQEAEQRRINEKNQRSPRKPQVHVTGTSVPYTGSPPRSDSKPLPDSIIQTLTQRVQNRVQEKPLPPRRRLELSASQEHIPAVQHETQQRAIQQQKAQQPTTVPSNTAESQEKMLSVSGKKKCSHCGDELGRGAAMIIESLRLFYHMECFKCCVCHVRLGDGLMGTDVRVRNHKLHCHNCYSSDDGVKFSCV